MITTHQLVKKNALIFRSGDASDAIYVLVKGIVKIGNQADDEREVIKHILHPMAVFGELSLGMDAAIVDDNGHPLGAESFAVIGSELTRLYDELAARDLAAGSAAARRLFS